MTHFAVPLIPVLDELCVPAINWAGSALARGAWGFQLKVGSLPDEAGHLTRLIALRGHRRVAVARDAGPIGDEYLAFLRGGLEALGVEIVAELTLGPRVHRGVGGDARARAAVRPLPGARARRAWRSAGRSARSDWNVPIIGNIGIGVFPSPELDGVVFTDVVDETNPVLARFARRYEERYGDRPLLLGLAAAHDLAATTIEALRLAPAARPPGCAPGWSDPRSAGGDRCAGHDHRLRALGSRRLQGPADRLSRDSRWTGRGARGGRVRIRRGLASGAHHRRN